MARTLVVNPGSTSKKLALYDNERCVFSMRFEKTPDGFEQCVEISGERQSCGDSDQSAYRNAVAAGIAAAKTAGVLSNTDDIDRVALRVVAPGRRFQSHAVITPEYIIDLQSKSPLAPLHTPGALREIAAIQDALPDTPVIGVSDSAFHAHKPSEATRYSISPEDAQQYDIYRFGYHGLSVASIVRRMPQLFSELPERTIVCHLGGGASVTALHNGVSVENSMGFSPESGVVMGSRAGDIDSGAMLALMYEKRMTPQDAHIYLNTNGGLQGLLGNGDLRYALDRASFDEAAAVAALNQYAYHIKKMIGAYVAVLGGVDALVLTASAPFRNPDIRSLILGKLDYLGIHVATQRNLDLVGADGFIQSNRSTVAVAVMQTDEMGEMARVAQTFEV